MRTHQLAALLLGFLLCAGPAGAQPPSTSSPSSRPDVGRPLIRTYEPSDVGGDGQNWAMVQDRRGVIYSGSANGVIEFDGVSWRLIQTPSLGTIRSLAIDDSGRIYVGGVGELGYLTPNVHGELEYVSMLDTVPPEAQHFSDVWRTFATPSGVYFQTEEFIFRWDGHTMHVIRPASRFYRAALVDNRLYVATPETGLNVVAGDHLQPLPGTQALNREVYGIVLRYDATRLLVGTRDNGLFLYDGHTLTPFPTEVDSLIKSGVLYRALALKNGWIALGTTAAGLAIIDRQGRRIAVLDVSHGLPSNAVYYLMTDRDGALWAAGDHGFARIETPSPMSFFDRSDGYLGAFDLTRHDGRLYFAEPSGVSYLDAAAGQAPRIETVPELNNQCWSFTEIGTALAVACGDGLFEIKGTHAVAIRAGRDGTYRAAFLLRSTLDPTRLWVGLFDGLASYRWIDGRWIDEGRIEPTRDQVRTLVEDPDGTLWAGTASTGLLRIRFASRPAPGEPRPPASVEHFGPAQGLPRGGIGVARLLGDTYFAGFQSNRQSWMARWNGTGFTRDASLEALPFDLVHLTFGFMEGHDGRVYANLGKGLWVLSRGHDGAWSVDRSTFGRFGSTETGIPLVDPDGVTWFGAVGRLIRDDRSQETAETAPFPALVRRVTSDGDRLLFAGAGSEALLRLPFSNATFRFEYAAPTFVDDSVTEYRTMLEGVDRTWSPWAHESRRDYTNIGFGSYRFRVEARDITGRLSREGDYAFTVLPPWYRTWWAYGGYVLLFGFIAFGIDRLQRRRLMTQERQRAQFTETRLRAEAAESLARAESEGKKNIELLSEIGREITGSLDFETIFDRLYDHVNELADADVFGLGLYRVDLQAIEYRLAIENGKRYAPYTRDARDPDQLPVWCIEHRQPVFINDLRHEYGKYLKLYDEQRRTLEDGSMSREPQSVIYLPLVAKDRVLGIITIQSFEQHAYTERHLSMMQSLASYLAIALDNAAAYRQLNEQQQENRQLFEEAERARGVAEEADAAKSAFLSTVSHELRTPLTSVLGFAKIIKKRLDDRIFPLVPTEDHKIAQTVRQIGDNLDVVVSEGERLTKLIDDVLDLAKIEAGKFEWQMDAVTIPDVIDHATAATASLFEQKGLHLVKQIDENLPGVTGDRDRLIQVVINLISNAVKFTESGSITCRARRDHGEVIVSVIDTGVGIAPADQAKVFERFKQVGDTLTDKPKGTGLGLPICREIVEHHGGRIWVESMPGRGSTFAFSLPATEVMGETGGSTGPVELAALIRQLRDQVVVTTPRTHDRKPRILVVDDDANIRELLTQELTDAGYLISTAVNGREAIAAVRRERPDLVVLDVMMPEMNGFDVAAVMKNDPSTLDIPIVILSIVQDRDRGYRLGVDRYLTKPIDTDLLFREVDALLAQKKSRKHVLVVDEDASTVRTLTDVLKARGYSVSEARFADLLEKAKSLQPDIIMLNSVASAKPDPDMVQMLRFEKGLENVLFLVYQ